MQVLKFGGTSVASAENMSKVVDIVINALDKDRTILVSSAISKCTDTLIEIGHRAAAGDVSYLDLIDDLQNRHNVIIDTLLPESYKGSTYDKLGELFESLRAIAQGVYLLGELSTTSLDAIQAFGELMSTNILSAKFFSMGISNKWIDSREMIKTNKAEHNQVDFEKTYGNLAKMMEDNPHTSLFVVPGFIASDENGRTTTLGRGGSDYTASIYAVGVKARLVEIWTDVTGIMTTNPKIVPTAHTISHISYRAALELSHFGAKVIYPPTIQPVVAEGIPIYVKNTFAPNEFGTLIEKDPPRDGGNLIGISNSDNIALISLEGGGMVGVPGFSSRLFAALSAKDINIILITQASSVHTMCIAISEKDAPKAKAAADECFAYEISLGKLNPLKVETGFSIVCLIGDDVIGHSGATGQMLASLGRHGIPVRATAQGSSERNISVIVPSSRVNEALRRIHNDLFDKKGKHMLNLFIAGYGNVGKTLVKMIETNRTKIEERTGKVLNICGVANSRKYIIDTDGLNIAHIPSLIEHGTSAADDAYYYALEELSLDNSIFVDCTANQAIGFKYEPLMRAGYSIVACNKIPLSGPFRQYKSIKETALKNGVKFRYETTVGAELPILETLSRCVCSGDDIIKVESVLSGTLSYLFNNYKGYGFEQLVASAKAKGYTEPDPQLDLSGTDVLRKLIIMAREAKIPIEESDIEMEAVPSPDVIAERYNAAVAEGKKLAYIGTLEKQGTGYKASIGLKAIGPDNALYNLKGLDNAAIITTDFYPSPLVVQGAGAGAPQTASGLLNDILK